MIKLGMPIMLGETLQNQAKLCKELGLQFIELNSNFKEYLPNRLNDDELLKIAHEHNIYYTMHLDDHFSPCHIDDTIAHAHVQSVLASIRAAKRLSIPLLNIHIAKMAVVTLPSGPVSLFDVYEEDCTAGLIAFRQACETEIGDADIKICIENYGGTHSSQFMQKVLAILLESHVFGLTFDIGHNAVSGFEDETIMMQYPERVYHYHIHDVLDRKDHLPLGDGELDIMKYLDMASSAVLEVKTVEGLKKSKEWLDETSV
ncbi:MAG: sugar phosphate isomerase/epimerase [Oscillospiraceae bacterium]|nr:sugar phosphate isomerase/epimerase [Oscillospiraceae bacterium]